MLPQKILEFRLVSEAFWQSILEPIATSRKVSCIIIVTVLIWVFGNMKGLSLSAHLRTVWNRRSCNFQSHSRTLFKHLVKVSEADQGTI